MFKKIIKGSKDVWCGSLEFDTTPKAGSYNPVTSGGVYEAISEAVADIPSIEAAIPEGAGEEDQLVKSSELNAVDVRLENVESKIPSSASSTDKLVTKSELDNATASMESGYTPKGPASVSTLNGLTDQENGDQYIVTDSGTLTAGSLAVTAGESVAWDSANEVWYEVNQYALKSVLNNAIQSIAPQFDPTRTSENQYKAGETVMYTDGKAYTFTDPHYGAWTGTDVLEFNVCDFVNKINKFAHTLITNSMISLSFGEVSGSGDARVCDLTVTRNATIVYNGGYASLSNGQVFNDVCWSYGSLCIVINVLTSAFVKFDCYAGSSNSFNPQIDITTGQIALPIASWCFGNVTYSVSERLDNLYRDKMTVLRSFVCAASKKFDLSYSNVTGAGTNRTCTVTLNTSGASMFVLVGKSYKEVINGETFSDVPYAYGALYFVVNKYTGNTRLMVGGLGGSGSALALTNDDVPYTIAAWVNGEVVYKCRDDIDASYVQSVASEKSVDTLYKDYSVTSDSLSVTVGTAFSYTIPVDEKLKGRKASLTIKSLGAAMYLGIAWNSISTSNTFDYKNLTANEIYTVDFDVPLDKTSIIVYANNPNTSGSVTIGYTTKSLGTLVSEIYPNEIPCSIIQPKNIYVVCDDMTTNGKRNHAVKMFVDHLVYGVSQKITPSFDGGKITKDIYAKINEYKSSVNSSVANTTKDLDEVSITENIAGLNTTTSIPVTFKSMSVRAGVNHDKVCRLLCIGDSVTQGYLANTGKPYTNCPEQYWAWAKAFFEINRREGNYKYSQGIYFETLGNILGTSWSGVEFDIDFDGISATGIKAYACGVGGSKTSDWLSSTLNNGETNPFYDPVAHKFSLNYWVNAYRTLVVNNDGTTTRCTNENKGTLVADVNAYNVCEPTHVLIQLGYNQLYGSTGTTRTNYLNDLRTMIDTIIEEYPSVKVLLSLPDTPCAYNVSKFNDILTSDVDIYSFDASVGTAKTTHDQIAFMNKDLMSIEDEYDGAVMYVPTYFASPSVVAGVTVSASDASFISSKNPMMEGLVMTSAAPNLHPNNAGHASMGYELYASLNYDLYIQSQP